MPGWTATTIGPSAKLQSRAGTALMGAATTPTPGPSSVGPVNALAQLPITADVLRSPSMNLVDPTLASRPFVNPNTGAREVAAQASVYQQPNVPAFLQEAVSKLNAEQALRRSMQSELLNKIMSNAQAGGPDAYLWQEALRAASVTPGAHVNFAAPIENPALAAAQQTAAQAYQQEAAQRTHAVMAANQATNNLHRLEMQRSALGNAAFGMYQGSPQQKLDQRLFDATLAATPTSSVQLLGRSAARNSGGWTPTMPTY